VDFNTGAVTEVFTGAAEWNKQMSGDGRFAVYDTTEGRDVYVRTIGGGAADDLVSQSTAGASANDQAANVAIPSDGRFVVFTSNASNLVAGDTNGTDDAFLRDRLNRTTVRVSVDASGGQFAGSTGLVRVSRNGQWIMFVEPVGGRAWYRVRNPAL
jgi:Tol biopolymer transport system component